VNVHAYARLVARNAEHKVGAFVADAAKGEHDIRLAR
jgi:hypothetical protein